MMKCPNCGAEIEDSKFCKYCGTQISSEMRREQEVLNKEGCPRCGSGNIEFKRENQGEIKGKKSNRIIHRTVGYCKDCGYTWYPVEESEPAKRKTWLWVLGWIVIFPVPLTILLLRKKDMKPALKYGIIAAGWIVYLLIGLGGNSSNSTGTNNAVVIDNSKPLVTEKSNNEATPEPTSTPNVQTPVPTPNPTPTPTASITANSSENTNNSGSNELTKEEKDKTIINLLDSALSQNATFEYEIDTSDENVVFVKVWMDGITAALLQAKNGDQNSINAWKTMADSMTSMSKSFQEGVQIIDPNRSVSVILLNDINKDNVLMSTFGDTVVYDALNN